MEGRVRAKAPSPPSPPAVRQVLGLLQRGQIDEAAGETPSRAVKRQCG